ncbi:hypothetical protein [Streptomyces sp. NPDC059828]|uniref:hypothetical protein n=1 Tax=Streptomyces sp. NPDC059828 TaxID=3346965 RepID=UPI00365B4564
MPRAPLTAVLRRDAPQAFLGVMGGAVSALVGSLLTARLLDPVERGHYAAIAVFTTLAVVALEMGGEVGVLRGMTEAEDAGRSFISGYFAWILVVSVSGGVLVTVVGDLAVSWLRPSWLVGAGVAAAVYAALVARIVSGVLLHDGGLRLLIAVRTVANCGPVPGCLIFVATGLTSAVELAAVSFLSQAVLNSVFLYRCRSRRGTGLDRPERRRPRAWRRDVTRVWDPGNVHLHLLNGSIYAMMRADQMALSVLGANATLGVYAVTANVAEVAGYLPSALCPLLSRGRPDRPVALRKIIVVLALAVAALTPLVYYAIPALYGSDYGAGRTAALILVPACGIFAVGRLVQGVELRDPAKRPALTRIALASAAIEFTVMWLLGDRGVVAAAWACAIGYTTYTVWVALVFRTNLLPRPAAWPFRLPRTRTGDGWRTAPADKSAGHRQ